MYTMYMVKRWTGSNSVINDCTYIKTINILNTVSINNKKSFRDEVAQMLRNAKVKQQSGA